MQANFSDQLRQAISHERLDAYRRRGANSDDADLFAYYAWNMALSESLYTPLQCLEVIRLVSGDHDIDCKIDGIGAMQLKSEFVKKA